MNTVQDIVNILERIAPSKTALEWDNVGLQLGNSRTKVNKILLALDVTPQAVEMAIQKKCQLIVSHHPLIFRPIKAITNPLHLQLIQHKIAVYSAHTNLDVAAHGVNFALANAIGLQNQSFLTSNSGATNYHMIIYVPQDAAADVAQAVISAGAGTLGNYTECLNSSFVDGQYQPQPGSHPYTGRMDLLERLVEQKLEFFCDSTNLTAITQAMIKTHPYETPIYSIYPVVQPSINYGLGMVGTLPEPLALEDFAALVKKTLGAPAVQCWPGRLSSRDAVQNIAVCSGSGGSVISAAANADVLLTGEATYHEILDSQVPLVMAGHFYTEQPVLAQLATVLQDAGIHCEVLLPEQHEIARMILL